MIMPLTMPSYSLKGTLTVSSEVKQVSVIHADAKLVKQRSEQEGALKSHRKLSGSNVIPIVLAEAQADYQKLCHDTECEICHAHLLDLVV